MPQDSPFSLLAGGFHRCDPSWNKPADGLDRCYKLYLPVDGNARLTLETQEMPLQAGCAYFVPGYRLLGQECEERLHVYWVHFVPESLYLTFLLSHVARVHPWRRAAIDYWAATWREIPRLFESKVAGTLRVPESADGTRSVPTTGQLYYRVQAMLMDVVSEVLATYRLDHVAAIDPVFEQLKPAIVLMDRRFLENPRLAEIARAAHLAPNYFHRKFTAAFHVTPKGYMLERRLNLGRQLLLSTDLSLAKIAARTGFGSEFHFSKLFKKHCRMSPTQFRKKAMP